MENSRIEISISEICYYLFFGILFFAKAIGLYDGQTVFKLCLLAAAGFAFIKAALTEYDIRELIGIIVLIALGGLVYLNSGEKSALVFLVMMVGFKNISMERIMKIGLLIWSLGFGGMVLKSILHIGNETVMAHHKFGMDMLRGSFGYSHPNVLHISYAILVVLLLFTVANESSTLKIYLWTLTGNVMVFLYSLSFTGFLLVLFFIAFHAYFTYRKHFSKLERILIQCVFPACVLFALFAPLLVAPDTPLFLFLNKALNRRFYASRLYLQENPVTLFGSRIFASHTYALDSSYVTLLIYGGLILFLLVCAGYLYAIHVSIKKNDIKALSMLLSFSIAGVIEPFLFNLSFKNLSLLIVAKCLFDLCGEGKKLRLLSGFDKKIGIGYKKVRAKAGWKTLVLAAAAALLTGGGFYLLKDMPEVIYVEERYCDLEEGNVLAIDEIEKPGKDGVVFYGYSDKATGFYKFEGKTISFEKTRDTLRLMFVIFLSVYLIFPFFLKKNQTKSLYKQGTKI